MAGDLIVLWLAAFALMGSPGPATLSLAAVGAAFGGRGGLRYLAGIIAGTFCVLLLIATGVTGLILTQPVLATALALAGAAYILYLAYRIATAEPISGHADPGKQPPFAGGFALAIANPKAFAAIAAVYAGHRLFPADPLLDAGVKIAALSLVIAVVNTGWLLFGTMISGVLRSPRSSRIANRVFALLLLVSVAFAFL